MFVLFILLGGKYGVKNSYVSSKVLIRGYQTQSNKNNRAYPMGNRDTYILFWEKYLVLLPQCLIIGVADFLLNLMYHVCEWLFFMV